MCVFLLVLICVGFQIVGRRRAANMFVYMRVIGNTLRGLCIQCVSHGCCVLVRCACWWNGLCVFGGEGGDPPLGLKPLPVLVL